MRFAYLRGLAFSLIEPLGMGSKSNGLREILATSLMSNWHLSRPLLSYISSVRHGPKAQMMSRSMTFRAM